MKKFTSLFTLLFISVAGLFAQAPNVEEIAATYLENIGGTEAWLAVKSIKSSGKAAMQGMEFPMTMTMAEGDKTRLDVDVQGQKIIQAYDGETAWQVMPFMGITEPTAMSPEEAAQMKDQKFLNEFINSEERGFVLTAVEGKEVEGAETYGVKVTNEAEEIEHIYYFDTEYMIPVMMATPVKAGPGKGQMVETYMSDYKEVDGLMMATFMEVKVAGQTIQKITLSDFEVNPEIDETMFALPK
ncbi:MAG: hypothetical protein AAFZ52_08805 [Bacteroidota bacterium]